MAEIKYNKYYYFSRKKVDSPRGSLNNTIQNTIRIINFKKEARMLKKRGDKKNG